MINITVPLQGLDADTISSVIKTAVNAAGEYGADFAKLFQLPGARNISADELCSLIQLAGRKEANRVVIRLARWGAPSWSVATT